MENFDKLKEVLIDVLGAKEEDIKTEPEEESLFLLSLPLG